MPIPLKEALVFLKRKAEKYGIKRSITGFTIFRWRKIGLITTAKRTRRKGRRGFFFDYGGEPLHRANLVLRLQSKGIKNERYLRLVLWLGGYDVPTKWIKKDFKLFFSQGINQFGRRADKISLVSGNSSSKHSALREQTQKKKLRKTLEKVSPREKVPLIKVSSYLFETEMDAGAQISFNLNAAELPEVAEKVTREKVEGNPLLSLEQAKPTVDKMGTEFLVAYQAISTFSEKDKIKHVIDDATEEMLEYARKNAPHTSRHRLNTSKIQLAFTGILLSKPMDTFARNTEIFRDTKTLIAFNKMRPTIPNVLSVLSYWSRSSITEWASNFREMLSDFMLLLAQQHAAKEAGLKGADIPGLDFAFFQWLTAHFMTFTNLDVSFQSKMDLINNTLEERYKNAVMTPLKDFRNFRFWYWIPEHFPRLCDSEISYDERMAMIHNSRYPNDFKEELINFIDSSQIFSKQRGANDKLMVSA